MRIQLFTSALTLLVAMTSAVQLDKPLPDTLSQLDTDSQAQPPHRRNALSPDQVADLIAKGVIGPDADGEADGEADAGVPAAPRGRLVRRNAMEGSDDPDGDGDADVAVPKRARRNAMTADQVAELKKQAADGAF